MSCVICCETNVVLVDVGVRTSAGSFQKILCNHKFCKGCMFSWVKGKVEEGVRVVRCPYENCKFTLYRDDVLRLTDDNVAAMFDANLSVDHRKRLVEKEDKEFVEWSLKNTKACPACHVIVLRSEGCNHMVCVCGHTFCYGCGKSPCFCHRPRTICGYCSRMGHTKRRCPRILCFACKQKGHFSKHCPTVPTCEKCALRHVPTTPCPPPKQDAPSSSSSTTTTTSGKSQQITQNPLLEVVVEKQAQPQQTPAPQMEAPTQPLIHKVQNIMTALRTQVSSLLLRTTSAPEELEPHTPTSPLMGISSA